MNLQNLIEFYYKIIALIIHFIKIYSRPNFELISIDNSPKTEDCLVYFKDNNSGLDLYKNIKDIIENKKYLKNFSSNDASKIGFSYGKLLGKNEII